VRLLFHYSLLSLFRFISVALYIRTFIPHSRAYVFCSNRQRDRFESKWQSAGSALPRIVRKKENCDGTGRVAVRVRVQQTSAIFPGTTSCVAAPVGRPGVIACAVITGSHRLPRLDERPDSIGDATDNMKR